MGKDYLKQYCAEHREHIYSNVVEWRKKNRDRVNSLQNMYARKKRMWNKIVKEFNNILLDGY